MNRLGLIPDKIPKIYARLMQLQSIQKPIGLMTHFSEADDLKSLATQKQLFIFQEATAHLTGPRSLANSAAIIAHPQTHRDWVRPGIMLYGATPLPGKVGSDDGLKSVMTLSSRLIAINRVKKGDKVGYGGAWTADVDTLIGVVGIGYGDGYPQFALNGAPVLVNGMECPLAGRVSMDMLTVDLRHCPNAKINDPVILWGSGLPVERIAQFSQTSAYEILTRMTPRPKVDVLNG
jgi:alanine racemase